MRRSHAILFALLAACSSAPQLKLEPDAASEGEVLDAAGEVLEVLDAAGEVLDAPAELPVFALDYRHCRGAWADRDDSSTRYTPHPETGLCTFACVWQNPSCEESWYGDPRCYPAHAARLAAVCAELGGACRKALTSDVTYCEVLP